MELNPIIKICAEYMAVGKYIREIRPGNRIDPKTAITVVFTDGTQAPHEVEAVGRDQFLQWSSEASTYVRSQP